MIWILCQYYWNKSKLVIGKLEILDEVYAKHTFVHKAKNKEMRRWASENDTDSTTLAVSISEVVGFEVCNVLAVSWFATCNEFRPNVN